MDIKRITSIILGFPLVVLILTLGNKYIVDICLAFIAMLGMQEYFNAISKDSKPVKWVGYVACLFIAVLHILPIYLPSWVIFKILGLIIPTIMLILFSQVIFTNMKTTFKDIAYTFFGMAYVIGCITFIALLRGLDNGRILVWYAIIAAWGTDTFAYLIGCKFGKHKLSKISPKKSIEGAIGGVVGATVIAILYTLVMNNLYNLQYSYLFITIITIITILLSIIGQIGDFAASSIKRYVDIKDYSNLIPGHGGMLDRIDSLMFIAPFAYVLISII